MKVKLQSISPRITFEVDNVYFSSDLHHNHQSVINYGRKFKSLEAMNEHLFTEINSKVGENDMLVLLGDTLMGEKDYNQFLSLINCENVIMLYGNHCVQSKFKDILGYPANKLLFHGHYLELSVDKQYICCSHYPIFHWNYQDRGSFMLHGHLHADESDIVKQMHEYKTMDVGIDSYYKLFREYSLFSFSQICDILKHRKVIERHGEK